MISLIKGNAASKTSWAATALIVVGAIQQSFPNIVDLIPDQYEGLAMSIIGGIMLVLRNLTSTSIAEKGGSAPGGNQGGFARVGMLLAIVAIGVLVMGLLQGCVTNPATGRQELSATGKVALQEVATIATRRYLRDHEGRAVEIAANVRAVALELQKVTDDATVSGLRAAVEAQLVERVTNADDLADAHSLLNVFEALLKEQIGSNDLDSAALVKVNEFAGMIVAALPAPAQ